MADGSKETLIQAAWDLIIDTMGFGEIGRAAREPRVFDQLTASRISRRAGVTTGAFYNRWDGREDFLEDFLDYALSPERSDALGVAVEVFESAKSDDPEAQVRRVAGAALEASADDPMFTIQQYLWAMRRIRPDIAERLRHGYEGAVRAVAGIVDAYLGETGRTLRPPFSSQNAARMFIALAEGLSLQYGLQPEEEIRRLFGEALLVMLDGVTQEA